MDNQKSGTPKSSSGIDKDAYTQHVMSNIPKDVFRTLNVLQLHAIEEAISKNAPYQNHPVDMRGTLSLFFARFYFVILIGRDRRSYSRNKEMSRRQKASSLSWAVMIYSSICIIAPVIFLLLYIIKSWLGIDIFPDHHLSDLIS